MVYYFRHVCVCVWFVTLCGFTLPDEVSASGVACGQELPLCILPAKFTKVPARTRKSVSQERERYYLKASTLMKLELAVVFP